MDRAPHAGGCDNQSAPSAEGGLDRVDIAEENSSIFTQLAPMGSTMEESNYKFMLI